MDPRCNNCLYWKAAILKTIGTLTTMEADDWCTFFEEQRYGEQLPKSWCWKSKVEDASDSTMTPEEWS